MTVLCGLQGSVSTADSEAFFAALGKAAAEWVTAEDHEPARVTACIQISPMGARVRGDYASKVTVSHSHLPTFYYRQIDV